MERYLAVILAVIGGGMIGAMLNGMWYERRYRRALELERERERLRYYGQLGRME